MMNYTHGKEMEPGSHGIIPESKGSKGFTSWKENRYLDHVAERWEKTY